MDYVLYNGLKLPPPYIPRHGGKDDASYVKWALRNLEVAEEAGLRPDSRVLDIGCGAGRFLTALLAKYGKVNTYVGLDVKKPVIDWCQSELTDPAYGKVEFKWINIENPRYNKARDGSRALERSLPVEDHSFDMIVLFSVFSHMTKEDTGAYLKEIKRALAPGGICLCSAFVESDVPDWTENPEDYLGKKWRGPLHCVRFNKNVFDRLIEQAGLSVEKFVPRVPPANQGNYTLKA